MVTQALVDIPLPAYLFVFSCLAYLFGNLAVNHLHAAFSSHLNQKAAALRNSTLDLAERGSLQRDESLSDEEVFQLEKRAFFSRVGFYIQTTIPGVDSLSLTASRRGFSSVTRVDS